jgi:hypothetical protein
MSLLMLTCEAEQQHLLHNVTAAVCCSTHDKDTSKHIVQCVHAACRCAPVKLCSSTCCVVTLLLYAVARMLRITQTHSKVRGRPLRRSCSPVKLCSSTCVDTSVVTFELLAAAAALLPLSLLRCPRHSVACELLPPVLDTS